VFPLPPFNNTVILEPLETNVEKYKALYKEVQNKIDSIYDMENAENVTFDKLLHNVVEINEDKYIKVIRSSLNGPKVFLKRKPSEVRVNRI
jgi:alanyl-tRNA synthetase